MPADILIFAFMLGIVALMASAGKALGGFAGAWLCVAIVLGMQMADACWRPLALWFGQSGISMAISLPMTYLLVLGVVTLLSLGLSFLSGADRALILPEEGDKYAGMLAGIFAGAFFSISLVQACLYIPRIEDKIPLVVSTGKTVLIFMGQQYLGGSK